MPGSQRSDELGESHQCSATGPKTLQSEHRLRDGGAGSGKALVYTCYYTGDLLTSLTRGRRFPLAVLFRISRPEIGVQSLREAPGSRRRKSRQVQRSRRDGGPARRVRSGAQA